MKFNRNNKISVFAIVMLFSMAFFSRCAQPAAPQGGPVDTIPPIMLSVVPANFSTNFTAREVIFTFNEYLQLKDIQKEILISPPLAPQPIFSVKGRSVVMKFPPELVLDSNTTYKIDFGSAITDNNEGNPAKRFEYIFSTGSSVDSLVMTGKLADAITGENIINGFAIFFADEVVTSDSTKGDSTLLIGKRLSIARTDSTGNFIATNLKPIKYRVFGLKDDNSNLNYDFGSKDLVGLSNERYNPAEMEDFSVWIDPIKDRIEVTPQIKLNLFSEEREVPQKLDEITRPKEYMMQLTFLADSVKFGEISIDSLTQESIMIDDPTKNDTVRVWIKPVGEEFIMPDTLNGFVSYYVLDSAGVDILDTTTFSLTYFKSQEDKKGAGAAKVAAKFDSVFKKIGDWFKRVFMSKRKRLIMAKLAEIKHIADSIKQVQADSLALVMRADSLAIADSLLNVARLDSIARAESGLPEIENRDSLEKLTITYSLSGTVSPEKVLYISSEYPMVIDTSKMDIERLSFEELSEDDFNEESASEVEEKPTIKTAENYSIERDSLDITRWKVNVNWQPNSEYNITMHNDAAINIIGHVNDSTTTTIKTYNPEERAIVAVNIKLLDSLKESRYIVSLLDSTNNIIETKSSMGQDTLFFNYLEAKKYKLKFVNDVNGNDKQDMGVVLKNIEPEEVEIYYFRANDPLFTIEINTVKNITVYPESLFDKEAKKIVDMIEQKAREEEEARQKELEAAEAAAAEAEGSLEEATEEATEETSEEKEQI